MSRDKWIGLYTMAWLFVSFRIASKDEFLAATHYTFRSIRMYENSLTNVTALG